MVKRKCGTCRFFQDQGLASSGWCRHPERCDIQDMVLVRKAELACRNGWDQDLWEPAAASDAPARMDDDSHLQIPDPSPPGRRAPARALVPAVLPPAPRASESGELYTDKLTSIRVSLTPSPPHGDARRQSAGHDHVRPVQDGMTPEESRMAVREARRVREEARKAETRQTREAIVRAAGELLDGPPNVRAPAVRRDPVPAPLKTQTAPSRAPAGPSAPRVPSSQGSPSNTVRGQVGPPSVDFPAKPPAFASPPSSADKSNRNSDDHSVTLPKAMQGRGSRESHGTEPLPDLGLRSRNTAGEVRPNAGDLHGQDRTRARRGAQTPSSVAHGMPRDARQRDGVHIPDSRTQASRQHVSIGVSVPIAMDRDPIDLSPMLTTSTRCCENCRDFKRVGDGNSGWCTNPYAFAERRMVLANELACRSSIGVWWLPHDDLWLERADITHHGRPTPNLDEELRTGHVGRQGMGPRSS